MCYKGDFKHDAADCEVFAGGRGILLLCSKQSRICCNANILGIKATTAKSWRIADRDHKARHDLTSVGRHGHVRLDLSTQGRQIASLTADADPRRQQQIEQGASMLEHMMTTERPRKIRQGSRIAPGLGLLDRPMTFPADKNVANFNAVFFSDGPQSCTDASSDNKPEKKLNSRCMTHAVNHCQRQKSDPQPRH